ncbi:MAG: LppX_LprAFG lipoprotein [Candidatus Nanopelagicales bacterium]|nr:LppX_LprAFG lipoprotein [Candidatus Nanopelagicales bacterium]
MTTRLSHIAVVLTLGLALAGCTSATDTPDAPSGSASTSADGVSAIVVQAGEQTLATGSARFSATMTTPGSAGTQVTMDGTVNFAKNEVEANLKSKGPGGNGRMRLISADEVLYIKTNQASKWMKTTAGQLGEIASPSEGLANLDSITGMKKVGSEKVAGVRATKYQGTLDLLTALGSASMSDENRQALEQQMQGATAKVTVWIDGDGRVLQFKHKGDIVTAEGLGVEYESTMRFYDFGVATNIKSPPASDVVDAGELADMVQK